MKKENTINWGAILFWTKAIEKNKKIKVSQMHT
jgi:hypothetical protein